MTAKEKPLKYRLEQYIYIQPAIERLEQKINEAYGSYFRCSVQSSNGPGNTLINESVGGYDNVGRARVQISEMRAEIAKLGSEMEWIEKYIDSITDLRVRQIISTRYLDGKAWREVVIALGSRESESSVKMTVKRFLEKSCDECAPCDETVC